MVWEWNWWVGRALPWHRKTEEGDGGECGEKTEVDCGALQVLLMYVHVVSSEAEVGFPTGGGGGCWCKAPRAFKDKAAVLLVHRGH